MRKWTTASRPSPLSLTSAISSISRCVLIQAGCSCGWRSRWPSMRGSRCPGHRRGAGGRRHAAFQRKCFAQIDHIRNADCTIILVSHDMGAITSHCDRALLLDRGQLIMSGPPKPLADRYLAGATVCLPAADSAMSLSLAAERHDPNLAPMSTLVYPQHGAEITAPRILTPEGKMTNLLRRGEEYDYAFDVRFDVAADNIRCGMLIRTPDGRELGGLTSAPPGAGLKTALGMRHCQKFRFRCNFLPGTYFVNAGVVEADGSYLHRIIDAAMFVVLPESDLRCTGCVDISPVKNPQ
jgi:lipopolysaccharide transport system ATP-binding protein